MVDLSRDLIGASGCFLLRTAWRDTLYTVDAVGTGVLEGIVSLGNSKNIRVYWDKHDSDGNVSLAGRTNQ